MLGPSPCCGGRIHPHCLLLSPAAKTAVSISIYQNLPLASRPIHHPITTPLAGSPPVHSSPLFTGSPAPSRAGSRPSPGCGRSRVNPHPHTPHSSCTRRRSAPPCTPGSWCIPRMRPTGHTCAGAGMKGGGHTRRVGSREEAGACEALRLAGPVRPDHPAQDLSRAGAKTTLPPKSGGKEAGKVAWPHPPPHTTRILPPAGPSAQRFLRCNLCCFHTTPPHSPHPIHLSHIPGPTFTPPTHTFCALSTCRSCPCTALGLLGRHLWRAVQSLEAGRASNEPDREGGDGVIRRGAGCNAAAGGET